MSENSYEALPEITKYPTCTLKYVRRPDGYVLTQLWEVFCGGHRTGIEWRQVPTEEQLREISK